MRIALAVLVLGTLSLNIDAPAEANDRTQFLPTGPWAIDYADENCRLVRNFSDGDQRVTLYFERFVPGPYVRLGLAGEKQLVGTSRPTVKYRYGAIGSSGTTSLLVGRLTDGRKIAYLQSADILDAVPTPDELLATEGSKFSWLTNQELAAARTVDAVELDGKLNFQLGSMEAPIKALQTCIADLVSDWGLNMDQMTHMSRKAAPLNNPRTWVNSSDYPPAMLKAGVEGVVGFRLVVDQQGMVKRCFVDVDNQGPFQIATCDAVKKRARFTPALDANGNPMLAIYACSVQFQLY